MGRPFMREFMEDIDLVGDPVAPPHGPEIPGSITPTALIDVDYVSYFHELSNASALVDEDEEEFNGGEE